MFCICYMSFGSVFTNLSFGHILYCLGPHVLRSMPARSEEFFKYTHNILINLMTNQKSIYVRIL